LQSVESQFAAAAATTAGAYQAAFEEAPSNFMGDENGNAVDPAQEFMTGAAAVPAALDTILAVGATELGSDDDMSGIVFAAETLTTGLDASGAVVAGALAAGADVFTAGAVRLGTEFMNNMAPDMGGSEGPGTVFADALEGGAMQIAGGIDAGANALTNTVPLAIAGGLGDGATTFAEQFEGGAVDLAAAIRGGDGDSDEDTGNGAPELDPSIITGNLPSGNNAPEFDPAMIAGQIENGITSLASMAPAFPTPDFPMGT
jgi:hypothetical protein